MTPLELILAGFAVVGALGLAVVRGPRGGVGGILAAIGLALLVGCWVSSGLRLGALPIYAVVGLTVLRLLWRWRRGAPRAGRRRRWWRALVAYGVGLVTAGVVALDAALLVVLEPMVNDPLMAFRGDATADFSRLAWPAAFERMHDRLRRTYALGDWKKVEWQRLHDEAAPRIAAAARAGDRAAYYLALRSYLWAIHDGHVGLEGDDGGARSRAIAGGYGLGLIRLDDGRTIAHVMLAGGPAAAAGMAWGAQVTRWDSMDVDTAVARTSPVWNASPPATREGLRLAQMRWLARAPVGTAATIEFRNPGERAARVARLTAVDDRLEALRATGPLRPAFSFRTANLDVAVLDAGRDRVGYLKIRGELPTLRQLLPDRVMGQAVARLVAAGVRGVILDTRGNIGGADKLVPRMMGFFLPTRQFYEVPTLYDERRRAFARIASETLWAAPRAPRFEGPIAVLVDGDCVSSGEGFALLARRRPGGHVVGFHGTYGSFGMSGATIVMPAGLTVAYPDGQSLDETGAIQVDSDDRMVGGIEPDIRVPVTLETVGAQFRDKRDVVLEAGIRAVTGR